MRFVLATCLMFAAPAAATAQHYEVVRYTLPAFDSARVPAGHTYTRREYESWQRGDSTRLEVLTYASDGIRVKAHLAKPLGRTGKLPVIIFNRGSYTVGDWFSEYLGLYHAFAQAGYIVVAPQYRESFGAAGHDEMGGADVDDVLNLLPALAAMPDADTARIFMAGESRGGMMTYQAIREKMPIKAAAVWGAFTDLELLLRDMTRGNANGTAALIKQVWPDYDANSAAIIQRRSALRWAEQLDVPLLIMHGGADPQVTPTMALDLGRRLAELKKPFELIIFDGDRHTLPAHQRERNARVLEWFAKQSH